jgi:hypothetical protein
VIYILAKGIPFRKSRLTSEEEKLSSGFDNSQEYMKVLEMGGTQDEYI